MNRREVLSEGEVQAVRCVHRCVRRGFLCGSDPLTGKDYEHRREWIRNRLEFLAGIFGIDAPGFSVMSHHFHLALRSRPDVVHHDFWEARFAAALADGEGEKRWAFILDEPEGKPATLHIDTDGDEGLANGQKAKWDARTQAGFTMYSGQVDLGDDRVGAEDTCRLGPTDERGAQLGNTLMYYADHGGEVVSDSKTKDRNLFPSELCLLTLKPLDRPALAYQGFSFQPRTKPNPRQIIAAISGCCSAYCRA